MEDTVEPVQYFRLMDDARVYAVIRRQGGLLERWSPDRNQWKEALWHWDVFFGFGEVNEKVAITVEEAQTIIDGGTLGDIADGDWDYLTHRAPSDD